jgi:EpsI family protein
MTNKNFLIIVFALILTTIISFALYFPKRMENTLLEKISSFPKNIGDWTSEDIALTEREYALLETRNLIVRNYINKNGDAIDLYIIYSPSNRKVIHPPEICLQGGGATITNKKHVQITDSIRATQLILEQDASRDLVVYWYKSAELNTDDYLKQQIKVVLDRIQGKETSAALIRTATKIEDGKVEPALERIKAFCSAIEPLLNKYVP